MTDGMTKELPEEKMPPAYHAEKCPVCNGFGTLKYGAIVCQGCKGQGYILVPNFKREGEIEGGNNEI